MSLPDASGDPISVPLVKLMRAKSHTSTKGPGYIYDIIVVCCRTTFYQLSTDYKLFENFDALTFEINVLYLILTFVFI